jgi:hypothetical protein
MRRPRSIARVLLAGATLTLLIAVTLRAQSPQPKAATSASARHAETLFSHSDDCVACHNNLVSASGEDVSLGTAWRSTIMANAARDPYFYASVRRETLDHPSRAAEIQDECASCHVPIARQASRAGGRLAVILGDAATDLSPLTRDGVSCTVCHQIAADGLGSPGSFNGNFTMRPSRPDGVRDVFGPFDVDAGRHTIMRSVTGFEQVEAAHVRQSELCATCHTLITEAVGRDGRVVGSLHEQMNYQEWRHSAFSEEGKSCQSCHMPRVEGPLRVASVLGAERDGLARHAFVGGNAFMLRLLNRYREELGVEAPPEMLEATARRTEQQLRNDTATLDIQTFPLSGEFVEFTVTVRNLTGHKFPTGYPSRRAWLHVTLSDSNGQVVFESGAVSATGAISGNASDADPLTFEPHYDVIDQPEQVQVYESIMGDAESRPTTGLLSAVKYLKDNRILPRGFDKPTAGNEIAVVGHALADASFTGGSDRVRYRIRVTDGRRPGRISAELIYQPIAYRWAHNLSGYTAAEPARFVELFGSLAHTSSTVVASASRTP